MSEAAVEVNVTEDTMAGGEAPPMKMVFEESTPKIEEISPVVEETALIVEETAPVVVETAPVVEETSPVVEETAPVVEETAPVVEETAPVVVETAPVVKETAPVVEETSPVVEETTPVVEETMPVVEEAAPVVVETAPVVDKIEPVVVETTPVVDTIEPVVEEIAETSTGPIIEEISEISTPTIAPVDNTPAAEDLSGGGDSGKQTRAQKKVMKAMAKLNLKHVPGIMKVVLRNGKKGNINFSIHGGEVYKVPGSDTYIVFGQANPDDFVSRAQMKAAEKFKIPEAAQAPSMPRIEDEDEDDADVNEAELDTEGVEEKDIELVMQQAGVSKVKAVKALKKNSNDIVNAIMELTM